MGPLSSRGGHSALVNMSLLVSDRSLRVAQMGPDFLLLESPIDHPPGIGSVVLRVDQAERKWNVLLPQGISAGAKRVAIAACQ